MRVLLLRDVKKVGKKHEVKEISEGYARNFLIPRGLAAPANEAAMKLKIEAEKKEKTVISKYESLAKKLEGEILEFNVKTGAKGEVFGSVAADIIKKALQEKGYGDVEILLNQRLRSVGDHRVEVNFGRGIKGAVTVRLLSQS